MRFILVLAVSLCLVACATMNSNPKDASKLEQRIKAYYRAKIAADYKEAFKYEHMSLDGKFSVEYYMKNASRSSFVYKEASIESVDIDENKGTADVRMKVRYRLEELTGFEKISTEREQTFEDRWEFRGDNWYHMIKGMAKYW